MIDHVLALPEGYRLQEYVIRGTLGFGGFGITYKAWDTHLEKTVAIKEYLPSELAVRVEGSTVAARSDQDREGFEWGRQRFIDEARTVARFDHPNIIRIHRFFEENETGYIVMEYVDGRPLSAMLAENGTLEEDEIRAWLLPILEGLKVVHQANFLHRDIKPHNIMIRNNGAPVLLDFGAARVALTGHTRSLTSVLTPGFAPLEQYQTKGNQGPWTDIYSLGAVVYCCMTGRKPVDAIDRISTDHLEPPDSNADRVWSASLVTGVMAALRMPERERPADVDEWLAILNGHGSSPTRVMRTDQAHADKPADPDRISTVATNTAKDEVTAPARKFGIRPIVVAPLLIGLVLGGAWLADKWWQPDVDVPPPDAAVTADPEARPADPPRNADQAGLAGEAPEAGNESGSDKGETVAEEETNRGPATVERVPAEVAAKERSSEPEIQPARYALTINAEPGDAVIRFLNLDEEYRPGIRLEPGRYEVEVALNGYQPVTRTLEIYDQSRTIPIVLRPLPGDGQADVAMGTAEEDSPSLTIVTGCDDKSPTMTVRPLYPQRALTLGVEGHVTLEFTVDRDGRVVDPRVRSSQPEGMFENAALDAIRKFRYRPNTIGGQQHPCLTTQELSFRLNNSGG